MTAATLVGLMSVPGLAVLYGGVMQKRWSINSMMLTFATFATVLIVWVLWGFKMGFGSPFHGISHSGFFGNFIGKPGPVLSHTALQHQANIPLIGSMAFPNSALIYFQLVFAAITPILALGSVLGRVNFKAWIPFVLLWITCVYCVDAFEEPLEEFFFLRLITFLLLLCFMGATVGEGFRREIHFADVCLLNHIHHAHDVLVFRFGRTADDDV